MWYNKIEDENGFHQDENGTRYMVTECHRVIAPDGRRNAELGYTEFNNMEECLSAWDLSQVPETALTKLPEPALSKFLHEA